MTERDVDLLLLGRWSVRYPPASYHKPVTPFLASFRINQCTLAYDVYASFVPFGGHPESKATFARTPLLPRSLSARAQE